MQKKDGLKGLLACFSATTFFFYNMMQLTLFNSISGDLIHFYSISNTQLGLLSAAFLLANVICLIPNSILLDHFDLRKMSLIFIGLCTAPYFLLPLVPNLYVGMILRFIQGFGCTISLIVAIRVASDWFPDKSASVIGAAVSFGMLGGFLSNIFMPGIVKAIGWKSALFGSGFVGIGFFVLMLFFLFMKNKQAKTKSLKFSAITQSVKLLKNMQILRAACFVGMMSTPMYVIASLWGNLYLKEAKSFTESQSAFISSLIFLGLIIGSPLIGIISDTMRSRKIPMIIGAVLSLMVMSCIIFIPHPNYYVEIALFFVIGFLISTQVLGYPVILESSPPKMESVANGIAFFVSNSMGAIFQPLFGFLISLSFGMSQQGNNYLAGMLMFPGIFVICILLALFTKETYKK